MSDTVRITRECPPEALDPGLAAALGARLADDDGSILACCETRSTVERRGLLRRTTEITLSAAVLTARHLVWAVGPEGGPYSAVAAPLREIRVSDYETSDQFRLQPDSGMNVDGLPGSATGERGSAFLPLGPEAAGARFRTALRAAIKAAGGGL